MSVGSHIFAPYFFNARFIGNKSNVTMLRIISIS